jgi:hypothetical protein
MNGGPNLSSMRARRSRLGQQIGKRAENIFWFVAVFFALSATFLAIASSNIRFVYLAMAPSLLFTVLGLWQRYDLSSPVPPKMSKSLEDKMNPTLLGRLTDPISPRSAWRSTMKTNEGAFLAFHLLISPDDIANLLSENEQDMAAIWQATELLHNSNDPGLQLHGGVLAAALLLSNNAIENYLAQRNLRYEEVLEIYAWLDRLEDYSTRQKPYFGGIGRDWATGFTPTLEKFSQNLSQIVEYGKQHYHFLAHANLSDSIVHDLTSGAGGVAIVGPTGTGKTELIFALAERLLEGKDKGLKHYQVISLNASLILSSEKNNLEKLMLTLFYEAIQAGNVILFLDEAQLFFGDGLGAFNMAQILLPVMQARRLKLIAAFTPNDFQRMRTSNESLANSFSIVTVKEPSAADTMKVVEDAALTLEARTGLLVPFVAVREAYRLSGQYMSELAYPGKAINLLNQSAPHAVNKVVTAVSVQNAIEKMIGVKPGAAGAAV